MWLQTKTKTKKHLFEIWYVNKILDQQRKKSVLDLSIILEIGDWETKSEGLATEKNTQTDLFLFQFTPTTDLIWYLSIYLSIYHKPFLHDFLPKGREREKNPCPLQTLPITAIKTFCIHNKYIKNWLLAHCLHFEDWRWLSSVIHVFSIAMWKIHHYN